MASNIPTFEFDFLKFEDLENVNVSDIVTKDKQSATSEKQFANLTEKDLDKILEDKVSK